MPNKDIFCNAPWYELHIYWDGSLGFCCQEDHKIYDRSLSNQYNVRNMSIREWVDSKPMQDARMLMFNDVKNTICKRCYHEEDHSDTSRRHRCNQKSVIFTRTNFKESYEQSPGWEKFEYSRNNQGRYSGMPIDLHIDLGNYCNLTCKMCDPESSSSVATQFVKWGIKEAGKYIGTDWTRDDAVWNRVLDELAGISDLSNVHFMGGETLITKRFEDFVDFMVDRQRFDIGISFVTNGTVFNESLIDKLKKFKRVGLEVSIETTTAHNAYQRQGTDTELVLNNIQKYMSHCNGSNITLTLRPAISSLTIGYYPTLIQYCLEFGLMIKGLVVYDPAFFDARILPVLVRQNYLKKYQQLLDDYDLHNIDCSVDYNESDPHQLKPIIKNQILQCINLLIAPCPENSDELLDEMVVWCKRWDKIHGLDALTLYPELRKEFIQRGY